MRRSNFRKNPSPQQPQPNQNLLNHSKLSRNPASSSPITRNSRKSRWTTTFPRSWTVASSHDTMRKSAGARAISPANGPHRSRAPNRSAFSIPAYRSGVSDSRPANLRRRPRYELEPTRPSQPTALREKAQNQGRTPVSTTIPQWKRMAIDLPKAKDNSKGSVCDSS